MSATARDQRGRRGANHNASKWPVAPRQRRRPRDRGSVTAELALIIPSVIVLLSVILQVAVLGAARAQLQDAAAFAARLQARGESAGPALKAGPEFPATHISTELRDGLHCVHMRQERRILGIVPVSVESRGCALPGGL